MTENSVSTTALGVVGEGRAAAFLEQHNYNIVERNLDAGRGELDIIAWDGATLCFIEVKARSSSDFGGARGAVHGQKQARLWKAAEAYLAANDELWADPPECRFDVVAVSKSAAKSEWTCTLFRNAFESAGDP